MTAPQALGTSKWRRRLIKLCLLVAILVALFVVLEVTVRVTGLAPAPAYNRHIAWFTLPEIPEEGLQLDENPPYVANEHGFWIASPARSGINEDGFRSPAFDEPNNDRPKVLILGDQFAYGMLARPMGNSFADQLRSKGYQVFNLGIPDTAPLHYAELAEHYVPLLKPDAVIVCFYTGNDYNAVPPIEPHVPIMYYTNVGALPARKPNGEVLTPEESYERWRFVLGTGLATRIRQVILSSALLSTIGGLSSDEANFSDRDEGALHHLTRIKDVTEAHDGAFMLAIVPVTPLYATGHNNLDRALSVFASLDPLGPRFLDERHYEYPPQAYFNNEGHRLYSEWLDDELQARGLVPLPEATPAPPEREAPIVMAEGVLAWEQFTESLSLDSAQEREVQAILHGLQDQLKELFFRPTANGEASPGAWLAARSPQAAELVGGPRDSAFIQYVSAARMADGTSYGAAFAAEERAARQALEGALSEEQHHAFRQLGLDSLLRVDTGYDPFGDAVMALAGQVEEP